MADKLLDSHRDYLVEKHLAGVTAGELAREFGVTHKVIVRVLGKDYRPGELRGVSSESIIALHTSGESVFAIANKLGISRTAVRRRLVAGGVRLRTHSESELLRWSKIPAEQRGGLLAPAHQTSTGREKTLQEKCLAARTRESSSAPYTSKSEVVLHGMLIARGLQAVPQLAIGPYNCDLAVSPVAVEVWGGGWHFGGRHLARTGQRLRYLMDQNWHVLMLVVNGSFPLTPAVGDYIAAWIKKARREPAAIREYRVVWGAGKFTSGGGAKDDNIAVVKPFGRGRDRTTGQYRNVPK